MKRVLIILALISVEVSTAQTYEFGDVPLEHIEMQIYDKDSIASAVILFSEGNAELDYIGGEYYLTVQRHIRIKILSDEGLEEGDIELSYRNKESGNPQKINNIKAQSYSIDSDGNIVEESVGRRDRFDEELSEYRSAIKFTVPGLKKGSVFEYSYELTSNDPVDFPSWVFQSSIPVLWSEYTAKVPEWFKFLTYKRGFNPFFIEEQKTYSDRFNFEDQYGNTSRLEFKGIEYHYVIKDIKALRDEPYMKASMDYLSHIRFQLSAFQPPVGRPTIYLSTWPGVANSLLKDEDFGDRISEEPIFSEIVEEVTKDLETDYDRMVAIYNHVSKHMEWDEYYGIYAFDDLLELYESGSGSGSEINLILLQMLKEAGIEAYPVVLSTRSNGEILSLFPLVGSLNHTIVYAQLDEFYHLLDAKNEYRPYNLLPSEVLNGEGLVILEDNPVWIPLENQIPNDIIEVLNFSLNDTGYTGTISSKAKGFYAVDQRNQLDVDDLEGSVKESMFTEIEGLSIDSISIVKDKLDESFDYAGTFSLSNEGVENVLYFNPMVTNVIDENPFKLDEREFPIDYNYTFSNSKIIYATIPEGWTVDEAPETVLLGLPGQAGEFRRVVQIHGNMISINYRFKISKKRFMPEEYGAVKSFYDQVVSAMNEQFVLIKES